MTSSFSRRHVSVRIIAAITTTIALILGLEPVSHAEDTLAIPSSDSTVQETTSEEDSGSQANPAPSSSPSSAGPTSSGVETAEQRPTPEATQSGISESLAHTRDAAPAPSVIADSTTSPLTRLAPANLDTASLWVGSDIGVQVREWSPTSNAAHELGTVLLTRGAKRLVITTAIGPALLAESASFSSAIGAAFVPLASSSLTPDDARLISSIAPSEVFAAFTSEAEAMAIESRLGIPVDAFTRAELVALHPSTSKLVLIDPNAPDFATAIAFAARTGALLISGAPDATTASAISSLPIAEITLVGTAVPALSAITAQNPHATTQTLAGPNRSATSALALESGWPATKSALIAGDLDPISEAFIGYAAAVSGVPVVRATGGCAESTVYAALRNADVDRRLVVAPTGSVDARAASSECGKQRDLPSTRYAGVDAAATAVSMSTAHYSPNVDAVILVGRMGVPDGIAGAPLAARLGGPVLVVNAGSIPTSTLSELKRLRPRRIVILGGTGVVGSAVVKTASQIAPVRRYGGATRYETAEAIARTFGVSRVVYVAAGQSLADALPASVPAILDNAPVLLTRASGEGVPSLLSALHASSATIVGGTGVVSESVRASVSRAVSSSVSRLADPSGQATARAIADRVQVVTKYAYVGWNAQVDAMTAAPIAARLSMPLLYAGSACQDSAHLKYVQARGFTGRILVGGSGVLTGAQANLVCGSLSGIPKNTTVCTSEYSGYRATLPASVRPWCPPSGRVGPTTRITPVAGGVDLRPGWNGTKVGLVRSRLGIGGWQTMDPWAVSRVRTFQRDHGLPVTGVVDSRTWSKLGTGYSWTIDAYQAPITVSPIATRSQRIEAMISYAMAQRRSSYTWGGAGPYALGFDCSGLVLQSLYSAGLDPQPINVIVHQYPAYRTSRELHAHSGLTKLPLSHRQRGDLIFYHDGSGVINHVAIYLGNGMIVESGGIARDTHVTPFRTSNVVGTVVRPFP